MQRFLRVARSTGRHGRSSLRIGHALSTSHHSALNHTHGHAPSPHQQQCRDASSTATTKRRIMVHDAFSTVVMHFKLQNHAKVCQLYEQAVGKGQTPKRPLVHDMYLQSRLATYQHDGIEQWYVQHVTTTCDSLYHRLLFVASMTFNVPFLKQLLADMHAEGYAMVIPDYLFAIRTYFSQFSKTLVVDTAITPTGVSVQDQREAALAMTTLFDDLHARKLKGKLEQFYLPILAAATLLQDTNRLRRYVTMYQLEYRDRMRKSPLHVVVTTLANVPEEDNDALIAAAKKALRSNEALTQLAVFHCDTNNGAELLLVLHALRDHDGLYHARKKSARLLGTLVKCPDLTDSELSALVLEEYDEFFQFGTSNYNYFEMETYLLQCANRALVETRRGYRRLEAAKDGVERLEGPLRLEVVAKLLPIYYEDGDYSMVNELFRLIPVPDEMEPDVEEEFLQLCYNTIRARDQIEELHEYILPLFDKHLIYRNIILPDDVQQILTRHAENFEFIRKQSYEDDE